MNNFVQFKDRPEVFAKYLKDEKGVDITENSGIVKDFLIFGGAMIAIFGGLWLYNHYKNGKDDNIENQYWYWKGSLKQLLFWYFFINSVEWTINSVNDVSIRRPQVINSVSIRFWRLSIRYQFGKSLETFLISPKLLVEFLKTLRYFREFLRDSILRTCFSEKLGFQSYIFPRKFVLCNVFSREINALDKPILIISPCHIFQRLP